jgi:SAM-dependent methyltransferase
MVVADRKYETGERHDDSPRQHSTLGMLSALEFRLLRLIAPRLPSTMDGGAYTGKSKLQVLLPGIETEIKDKIVLDFGCGGGAEAKEMALLGAKRVIGLDISEKWLQVGRQQAESAGVADRCDFVTSVSSPVEVIVSLDSFEHFAEPATVLQTMYSLLKPGGCVLISFGPTWYHPLGGHLFSVFPWAHIVLKETALIRWRNQFKTDGATKFGEVEGGLNQMTISRFESLLKVSPFTVEHIELVPIRRLKSLHNRVSREFLTAVVRCRLRRPLV